MSRILTTEETAALAKSPLTLAYCWVLTDKLGNVSRHTSHDRDLVVTKAGLAGTYLATQPITATDVQAQADMAVDNMEITVPLGDVITLADLRAGILSGARYTIFIVDWAAPANTGIIVQAGVLGNARLVSERAAAIELRSLKQQLQQQIVPTCSRDCRSALGDVACTVDVSAFTVTGTVTSIITESRRFMASGLEAGAAPTDGWDGWYQYGAVTWLTGANAGLVGEVAQYNAGGDVRLQLPMGRVVAEGDTFTVHAGCDRQFETCQTKFGNYLNFQGEPFAPDLVIRITEAPR